MTALLWTTLPSVPAFTKQQRGFWKTSSKLGYSNVVFVICDCAVSHGTYLFQGLQTNSHTQTYEPVCKDGEAVDDEETK